MIDYRVRNLASILTDYSVKIKKGNLVCINAPEVAAPLIREVYRYVLEKGAFVELNVNLEGLDEIFYKTASKKQIEYLSEVRKYLSENVDIFINIMGGNNTRALTSIEPSRMMNRKKTMMPIMKVVRERTAKGDLQWTLTQYPTNAFAQEAEMSLSEYEDFVYGACFADREDSVGEWEKLSKEQERYIEMLEKKEEFHIEAPGTDLDIKAGGRKWINSDGKKNMPSGEVFTAPIEDSANGKISFSFPAIYNNRIVTGVILEFKKGKVVKASADKGEDLLDSMIDIDEGSRFLGEFAFGLNNGIQRFTKNILYDEKIGGTMHLALGAAYPECGGSNESALHWDMILDLRKEGRVTADSDVIFEDGEFKV